MKKLISALLAAALLSSGACFAADTSDSSKAALSLDSVGQVWTDHSPEYLKISSDLKIAKAAYDKLSDASDALSSAALYDTTGFYMYQASSAAGSLGQAELNYDIAAAQYDQKVANGILAAKQALLTCRQDELNLGALRSSLSQKQAQLGRYAEGVSRGYLSQKAYDTLQSAVYDLQNSLTGLETTRDADLTALKTKLGLSQDTALAFTWPALSGETFQALDALDPDADLPPCSRTASVSRFCSSPATATASPPTPMSPAPSSAASSSAWRRPKYRRRPVTKPCTRAS